VGVAMNLTRLQTFATVVRLGTLAAAADELSFTPSAVSQQMSKLEAELGVALLLRGPSGPGRQVALTDAGERLYAHALGISAAVSEAREDLAGLHGSHRDRLRVGAGPEVTAALLPQALRRLRRRLPGLRVEVVEAATGAELRRRGLDLVLCPGAPESPELVATPVARGPMLVALPPGHPLAELEAIAPAALAAEPVLGHGSAWDVTHPLALLALVRAGEGVAVVAPGLPGDGVQLRPLAGGPSWTLTALRSRERPALAGMALLEELRTVVAAQPHLRPGTAVALPLAA
jgi:DNA-binding transcriptional LysR family regulator